MDEDKTTKSLIIPAFTKNRYLEDIALRCINSHRSLVNEIILVEDGGMYSSKLRGAVDMYVYSRKNFGFTKTVNRGWSLASFDYSFIVNSDMELISGNLRDMCMPDEVISPTIDGDGGFGSYFVVPREIKDRYGLLDERLKNFASDDDYFERIKHIFRKEERVIVKHEKGSTVKRTIEFFTEEARRDAQIYDKIIKEEYPERRTDI